MRAATRAAILRVVGGHSTIETRTRRRGGMRSREMAVALAALGVALTASGIAFAVDTIRSGDIVNGEVKTQDVQDSGVIGADVAVDSLTGNDVAPNLLLGTDIADGSLNSAEVADETLTGSDLAGITGADIDESTLSTVSSAIDSARVDGVDALKLVTARSDVADAGEDECEGSVSQSSFEVCADLAYTVPHAGRVFVIVSGTWHIGGGNQTDAGGVCRIYVDGSQAGSSIGMGQDSPGIIDPHSSPFRMSFGGSAVTGSLTAASHNFELKCTSLGVSDVDDPQISIVSLGSG